MSKFACAVVRVRTAILLIDQAQLFNEVIVEQSRSILREHHKLNFGLTQPHL
jgi:hypothetical protein